MSKIKNCDETASSSKAPVENEPQRKIPKLVLESVLMKSKEMPADSIKVKGYDFNQGVDYRKLLDSYTTSGFQATNFGLAVEEINKMLDKKAEPRIPMESDAESPATKHHPRERRDTNCTIFLGYTSNLISSGIRETLRFLVQHNLVDVLVSTAGGIEEDIMKCLADTYLGDFRLKGLDLRSKGHNRIGNLLVPNDNYIKFEKWIPPILDQMLIEQNTEVPIEAPQVAVHSRLKVLSSIFGVSPDCGRSHSTIILLIQNQEGVNWTPSKMIARLGREINNPESVCYWAYKNNIPIFSPAITDGAIGDELYMHSYSNPGLRLDIVEDIRAIDNMAVFAAHSGMIILGGGLVKHHICNANLARNGADFSVFVNTGQEYDGSDAGARPDEAVSWGKIKSTARPVKLFSDFTLVFPLLVAETFARRVPLPHKLPKLDKGTTEDGGSQDTK